jgi:hypothetical protein
VKIVIFEKQLKNIKKSLTEEKDQLGILNNYMPSELVYKNGYTQVYLKDIELMGEIDDLSVEAKVSKIVHDDVDVSGFAKEWSIIDMYTSDDLPLGVLIKIFIVDNIDNIVKKALPLNLTEYDVVLHLY